MGGAGTPVGQGEDIVHQRGTLTGIPGLPPLFRMAVLKGAPLSVLQHIRRGAPVNGCDIRGMTPLMLAAGAGRDDICEVLVSQGADVAVLDLEGRSAARLASVSGHVRLAAMLQALEAAVIAGGETGPAEADEVPLACADGDMSEDGDWEAEEESLPAESDLAAIAMVTQAQTLLSAATPRNIDPDWLDIRIVLPRPQDRQESAIVEKLSTVFRNAMASGYLSASICRRLCRDRPGLARIIEDISLPAQAGAPDRLAASPGQAIRFTEADLPELEEAIAAAVAGRGALEIYQSELHRLSYIDRNAEHSMFRSLGQARVALVRYLITLVPLVGHVLGAPIAQTDGPDDPDLAEAEEAASDGELSSAASQDEARSDLGHLLRSVRDGAGDEHERGHEDVIPEGGLVVAVHSALLEIRQAGKAEHLLELFDDYIRIRNRICEAYLPLVLKPAAWYAVPGLSEEDVIQEGNAGLIRAVERFDISRGNRFMTYAIWWVRQSCSRYADDFGGTIRVPVHVLESGRRIAATRNFLTGETGQPPTLALLAEALGMPAHRVERLENVMRITRDPEARVDVTALDGLARDELDPLEVAVTRQRKRVVSRTVGLLDAREEQIIRRRFGIGEAEEHTLEEIGGQMGVTRERIRQIERRALERLTKPEGLGRGLRWL